MESDCPVCAGHVRHAFSARILGRYEADYLLCEQCGFLHIPNPTWLEEAYSSAIAATDTGIAWRNLVFSRRLAVVLDSLFGKKEGAFLDVAGGYGLLVRLMRDYGFDFSYSDKHCQNLFANGFEFRAGDRGYLAVTAIEVMEHLEDPVGFIEAALRDSGAETFVFTTELYSGENPPAVKAWNYYSLETGQHIAFYSTRTLQALAQRLGMAFQSVKGLHIFTRRPVPLRRIRWMLNPFVEALSAEYVRRRRGGLTGPDNAMMRNRLRDGSR